MNENIKKKIFSQKFVHFFIVQFEKQNSLLRICSSISVIPETIEQDKKKIKKSFWGETKAEMKVVGRTFVHFIVKWLTWSKNKNNKKKIKLKDKCSSCWTWFFLLSFRFIKRNESLKSERWMMMMVIRWFDKI